MKLILTFVLVVFYALNSISQEKVETVKIAKNESYLYRGQGQEISNGYLYVDEEGYFYFVILTISQSEVLKWFEQRKDSQNVYRGILQNGQYKTLTLARENEPGESMMFYFEKKQKDWIELISMEDGKIYDFKQVLSN
jgi:hypothetical protein